MDEIKVSTQKFNKVALQLHPAHLLIGSALHTTVVDLLQQLFCSQNSCNLCAMCKQLTNKEHPNVHWITPEKGYTKELIQQIHNKIAFKLDDHESFVFVLEKAHELNDAAANSLLKILEEPPRGYYFILLTNKIHEIVPTIQSRCHIHVINQTVTITHHPLYTLLTHYSVDPISFYELIEQQTITDIETTELIDALRSFWINEYKKDLSEKQKLYAHSMIILLNKSAEHFPMPGSSKIFWRNVMLQSQSFH